MRPKLQSKISANTHYLHEPKPCCLRNINLEVINKPQSHVLSANCQPPRSLSKSFFYCSNYLESRLAILTRRQ